METFKDIWASSVSSLKERTTNPLTFAFVLSWCLWNFRFFLVLLGDESTADKLARIDALYPSAQATVFGTALFGPVFTALLYIFVYPFLSERVIKFYRGRQVRIANSVREVEATRVLTTEEATALTRRHETARKKWESTEAALGAEMNELRIALAASEQQHIDNVHASTPSGPEEEEGEEDEDPPPIEIPHVDKLLKEIQLQNFKWTPAKRELLIGLSDMSASISTEDLARITKENYSVALLALEEMEGVGLVKAASGKHGMKQWTLTAEGRFKAVQLHAQSR